MVFIVGLEVMYVLYVLKVLEMLFYLMMVCGINKYLFNCPWMEIEG